MQWKIYLRICLFGPRKPFERQGQTITPCLGLSLFKQHREDGAQRATEQTFQGEPSCRELGRTSLPYIPKVRPSALVGRGPVLPFFLGERER